MQKISLIIFFIFSLYSNVLNSMQQSMPFSNKLYEFAIKNNVTLFSQDYNDEQTKIILKQLILGPEFLQEKVYHKFYTILGISPSITCNDIPYISLIDQNQHNTAQILFAYKVLTNEKLRFIYDLYDLEGLLILAQQYKQESERETCKRSLENQRTVQKNNCYKKARTTDVCLKENLAVNNIDPIVGSTIDQQEFK